jgi:hypothetical protein
VKLTGLLLQAGADAKASHANGYYPIDTASRRGNAKAVKRLLAAGSPTEEQTAAEHMERLWKRIGAWYAKNHAPYAESLERTRPATPARIATLEKVLKTKLPTSCRSRRRKWHGPGGTPASGGPG